MEGLPGVSQLNPSCLFCYQLSGVCSTECLCYGCGNGGLGGAWRRYLEVLTGVVHEVQELGYLFLIGLLVMLIVL